MSETVLIVGGIAAALGATMRWIVVPAFQTARGVIHFADALPVLQEIAEQFKPNGGLSLHDQVQEMNRGLTANADAIDEVKNLLENHVASVRPGGRRRTDP